MMEIGQFVANVLEQVLQSKNKHIVYTEELD